MPPPVYSTRIFAVHDLSGVITYTVPDGKVLIVRDIDVFWGVSTAGALVNFLGSANQVFYQASFGINDVGWRQWTGRQVLSAGEVVTAFSSDTMDVSASGYLLDAP